MAEAVDALVLEAPRRFSIEAVPRPEVRDDTGLLRVEACGLCGTDHEQFTGALHPGRPFVPGHEVVGVVEEVGSRAAERWGVSVGDRVAVEVFLGCGACEACRAGELRRCERHGLRTMYGLVGRDVGSGLNGGYATHLELRADSLLLPVPDGLDPVLATVLNPLGAGIRWGVRLPRLASGEVVAVLGPGIRGLCVSAAAKDAGAGFVMVTGAGDRDRERLAWAERFGADLTVDVTQDDPLAALREAAGRRADVVVDVTAMAPAAFAQAVSLAAPGGRVVVAGTRGFDAEAPGSTPTSSSARSSRSSAPSASTWTTTPLRSTSWRRAASRSPTCPGRSSGSTTPSSSWPAWPASPPRRRRSTASSPWRPVAAKRTGSVAAAQDRSPRS